MKVRRGAGHDRLLDAARRVQGGHFPRARQPGADQEAGHGLCCRGAPGPQRRPQPAHHGAMHQETLQGGDYRARRQQKEPGATVQGFRRNGGGESSHDGVGGGNPNVGRRARGPAAGPHAALQIGK